MLGWCASVPREGLTKSERQLLQFLALAQLTGLSIPMWQWILLRFCGRLVCQSAGSLILDPALPFTMGTVGSDSEFQDCASPAASVFVLMSTLSD